MQVTKFLSPRIGHLPAPAVIIVSGPPCTGKTTLARQLAHDLRMPLLSKDSIKEVLFDALGWSDRDWSRRLGRAMFEVLYLLMESELAAGRSFLVESNFKPELANSRFKAIREKYPFFAIQVQCRTDGAVLVERFRRRAESGERHPGHADLDSLLEVPSDLSKGFYEPLDLGGPTIVWDTTDRERTDYDALLQVIHTHMSGAEHERESHST